MPREPQSSRRRRRRKRFKAARIRVALKRRRLLKAGVPPSTVRTIAPLPGTPDLAPVAPAELPIHKRKEVQIAAGVAGAGLLYLLLRKKRK